MAETFVSNTPRPPLSEASNRINSTKLGHEDHQPKTRYDQSLGPQAYQPYRPHHGYPGGPPRNRGPQPGPQTPGPRPHGYYGPQGPNGPHGPKRHHGTYGSPGTHGHPRPNGNHGPNGHHGPNGYHGPIGPHGPPGPRVPPVLRPPQQLDDDKHHSQKSQDSSASDRSKKNYKTHIGPWQLGKTLGKGSSARVRLCRHSITNQLAAVKIVNRRMANLVHDSSLAALSKWDNSLPEQIDGEMRVPMAIEREVAILKLIEHPNIMKIYDIWENRSEVYLILEYIDQGDLFTFINKKGRLSEEVAIYFFRQIISAISYCHSFNICHRDLKPENILITADLQIKIADFGMAALHQTDTHQLATACGSPHYAAPELLKNRQYRGDRADIWSLGVILYAMLSATLPFDDPDLRVMMSRTKKGHYQMPDFLSHEAEDLIRRMLQVNPDRRITLRQIWKHPLVSKYSYLDNLGDINGQPPDTRKGFQNNSVSLLEVDSQLLRQLRSMWHMFSESELKLMLTCEQPNDQKAFYWLLYHYREKQLEDFKPELVHSQSDYHHLKPGVWKKRISTREFSLPRLNGHGRSISRFTVISNAADTEPGATITPHRPTSRRGPPKSHSRASLERHNQTASGSYQVQVSRARSGSVTRRGRMSRTSTTGRLHSSKGSLSSLRSSRQTTPHTRSLRHKRNVDFSSIRKRSSSLARARSGPVREDMERSPTPEVPTVPSGFLLKPSDKPPEKLNQRPVIDPRHFSKMFGEELRHFSSNIAKDCDDAFGSSLIEENSIASSLTEGEREHKEPTPFAFATEARAVTVVEHSVPKPEIPIKCLNNRPLPPLPPPEENASYDVVTIPDEIRPFLQDDQLEDLRPGQVETALPVVLTKHTERRVVSAPVYANKPKQPIELPSVNEAICANDKSRIVSAPPHTPTKERVEQTGGMDYLSRVENSIRVVDSPAPQSPVKIPKPLNVQKKPLDNESTNIIQLNTTTDHQDLEGVAPIGYTSQESQAPIKRKIPSWFKRSQKPDSDSKRDSVDWQDCSSTVTLSEGKQSDSTSAGIQAKRKTFNFPFWKSNKPRDSNMSIDRSSEFETKERPSSEITIFAKTTTQGKPLSRLDEYGSDGVRNIEVKQSWLARLFRVKPAMSHLCLTISRRRARQEIALLLREWRRYGIKGIQVDKQRNVVFGRVAAKNYLELKEVSFAAEVMTVIEHGKKHPLSIVRFTQERGAASSFHRVVDIIKLVFDRRGLMVMDKNREKMMIKTLNS